MKCFVASAFGKDDVDAVYDKCISLTLKQRSIKPLRVDRVEHNDDIDSKIFELLDTADIVIADLTYARPSVYYEAGYASGNGKPVIYTARNDHFKARDSDPEGLVRVHFDLQMRNIIPWSKPNDAFVKRLNKRLNFVLKPVLRERAKLHKENHERSQFSSLPQAQQLAALGTKSLAILRRRSFKSYPKKQNQSIVGDPTKHLVYRDDKSHRKVVSIFCTNSALKSTFERIHFGSSFGLSALYDRDTEKEPQIHLVIISLNLVPESRKVSALPYFSKLEDGVLHSSFGEKGDRFYHEVFLHVLHGIKSVPEFLDSFRSELNKYGL